MNKDLLVIIFKLLKFILIHLGLHETSSLKSFSYGVASRGSSVRIPRTTEKSGNGYWEDRRPAANLDPYVVCSAIFSTSCLESFGLNELESHYLNFIKQKNALK